MFRTFQVSECMWSCPKREDFERILSTVNNRTRCIEREGIEKIQDQVAAFTKSYHLKGQDQHMWINISKALNKSLFYLKSNALATVGYADVPDRMDRPTRDDAVPFRSYLNTVYEKLLELQTKFPVSTDLRTELLNAYREMDNHDQAKYSPLVLETIENFKDELSIYIIILKIYIESQNIEEFVEKYLNS